MHTASLPLELPCENFKFWVSVMFECKSKCQDIKKIKIVRRSKSSEDQSIDDCADVI